MEWNLEGQSQPASCHTMLRRCYSCNSLSWTVQLSKEACDGSLVDGLDFNAFQRAQISEVANENSTQVPCFVEVLVIIESVTKVLEILREREGFTCQAGLMLSDSATPKGCRKAIQSNWTQFCQCHWHPLAAGASIFWRCLWQMRWWWQWILGLLWGQVSFMTCHARNNPEHT